MLGEFGSTEALCALCEHEVTVVLESRLNVSALSNLARKKIKNKV